MYDSFYTKIAGTTHNNTGANTENRQLIIRDLHRKGLLAAGQELVLRAEPTNPYDRNAVAVFSPDGRQLGYLAKEIAYSVSQQMSQGKRFRAVVEAVTGGDVGGFYGVNIKVEVIPFQTSFTRSSTISAQMSNQTVVAGPSPEECFDLGVLYYAKDIYDKSIIYFKRAADAGIPEAQYYLGVSYDFGYGVTQDHEKAFRFYLLAAEHGNPLAAGNLGYDYHHGVGTERNDSEAYRWYKCAAEEENPHGMVGLGNLYTWGEGVTCDYKEAYKWFRKAAELGDREGMHNTGTALLIGRGVERDPYEAAKWNKKAAELGQPQAQFNLARQYLNGDGVMQDFQEAVKWICEAGNNGHAEAKRLMTQFGL